MAPNAPSWRETLEKHAPDMLKEINGLQGKLTEDGVIPMKTKILMMMLCDAVLGHPGGVASLANRARALGASEQEISETVAVAFLMGGMPGLVSAAGAFRD